MKRYNPDIAFGGTFLNMAIMEEHARGEYVEFDEAAKAAARTPLELAAPDLLAACKAAFDAAVLDEWHGVESCKGAFRQLEAAIAKTESEATNPE